MTAITDLLRLTGSFCGAQGIAESTLSTRLFFDGKRIGSIRAGGDVGARRLERAVQWLSDNWPDGAEWPEDVPRPCVSPPGRGDGSEEAA